MKKSNIILLCVILATMVGKADCESKAAEDYGLTGTYADENKEYQLELLGEDDGSFSYHFFSADQSIDWKEKNCMIETGSIDGQSCYIRRNFDDTLSVYNSGGFSALNLARISDKKVKIEIDLTYDLLEDIEHGLLYSSDDGRITDRDGKIISEYDNITVNKEENSLLTDGEASYGYFVQDTGKIIYDSEAFEGEEPDGEYSEEYVEDDVMNDGEYSDEDEEDDEVYDEEYSDENEEGDEMYDGGYPDENAEDYITDEGEDEDTWEYDDTEGDETEVFNPYELFGIPKGTYENEEGDCLELGFEHTSEKEYLQYHFSNADKTIDYTVFNSQMSGAYADDWYGEIECDENGVLTFHDMLDDVYAYDLKQTSSEDPNIYIGITGDLYKDAIGGTLFFSDRNGYFIHGYDTGNGLLEYINIKEKYGCDIQTSPDVPLVLIDGEISDEYIVDSDNRLVYAPKQTVGLSSDREGDYNDEGSPVFEDSFAKVTFDIFAEQDTLAERGLLVVMAEYSNIYDYGISSFNNMYNLRAFQDGVELADASNSSYLHSKEVDNSKRELYENGWTITVAKLFWLRDEESDVTVSLTPLSTYYSGGKEWDVPIAPFF